MMPAVLGKMAPEKLRELQLMGQGSRNLPKETSSTEGEEGGHIFTRIKRLIQIPPNMRRRRRTDRAF